MLGQSGDLKGTFLEQEILGLLGGTAVTWGNNVWTRTRTGEQVNECSYASY